MGDALRYAAADLRLRLRARSLPVWAALALGALALSIAFEPGEGAALATSWFPVVLGGLAFGLAAGSASTLPGDRAEGRAAWLATLRPWSGARRVGAALGGAALAAATGALAAGSIGLLAPAVGLAREVRAADPLPLPAARRFRDPRVGPEARPLTLDLGALAAGAQPRTLDVGLKPLLLADTQTLPDTYALGWRSASRSGRILVPFRGRLRLDLEPGDTAITLTLEEPTLDLVLRDGWVLGAPGSFALSLAWAGLLIGLAAAVLAPFAVAVSRVTSAPTAAGAALMLVLLSAMRAVLPEAAVLGPGDPLQQSARALLGAAVALAPDFSGLAPAIEPAAGRALGPSALTGLATLLPHALGFALLLLLPGRGVPTEDAA